MSVFSVTNKNFNEEVVSSAKPVLLDFWAPWCGPCRKLSPVVDQIAEENPHIRVGKVNVEERGSWRTVSYQKHPGFNSLKRG